LRSSTCRWSRSTLIGAARPGCCEHDGVSARQGYARVASRACASSAILSDGPRFLCLRSARGDFYTSASTRADFRATWDSTLPSKRRGFRLPFTGSASAVVGSGPRARHEGPNRRERLASTSAPGAHPGADRSAACDGAAAGGRGGAHVQGGRSFRLRLPRGGDFDSRGEGTSTPAGRDFDSRGGGTLTLAEGGL
jgi:hypothetical protein